MNFQNLTAASINEVIFLGFCKSNLLIVISHCFQPKAVFFCLFFIIYSLLYPDVEHPVRIFICEEKWADKMEYLLANVILFFIFLGLHDSWYCQKWNIK